MMSYYLLTVYLLQGLLGFLVIGGGVFFLLTCSLATVLSMETLLGWIDILYRNVFKFLNLDEFLLRKADYT